MSIQRHSALDVSTQANLAFNHDESAGLMLGKKIGGQHNVIVSVHLPRTSATEGQLTSETSEGLPDLRLENHDQRKYTVRQESANQPIQGGQFTQTGEIKSEYNCGHAHQHVSGARALDQGQ